MTAPNVGVTFSVAGQDPVLRAVSDLEARLKAAGAAQLNVKNSSEALGGAFSKLSGLARTLGLAFGAIELVQFGKGAIQAADQIFELSKKTGIGAEQLSILSFGAKQSGVDIDGLAKGLKFLGRAVGEALKGNEDVALSFDSVGVSLKDLQHLSLDELFKRVATGIQGVAEGSARTDVALHLFGRAGTELLPLLQELGGPGFGKMADAARKAAAVISGETAESAHELSAAFERLEKTGQGAILKLLGDGTAGGVTGTIDKVSALIAALGDLFTVLNNIAEATNKLPWKSGAVDEFLNRLFSWDAFLAAEGLPTRAKPPANILAGAGAAAPAHTGGPAFVETFSKAEVEDLAKLLSLGAATAAERQRGLAIEREITTELTTQKLTLPRHVELATLLNSLQAAREKREKSITDELEKQAAEAEAAAARERLRADQKARQDAATQEDEARRQQLIAAVGPRGFADFADLFARGKQTKPFEAAALPGLPEALPKTEAEAQAAVLRELMKDQQAAIDGNEQLGKSIRDAIAGDLSSFFSEGITGARKMGDAFVGLARAVIKSINDIVAQLIAAKLTTLLGGILGSGIPAAPTEAIALGPVLGRAEGGVIAGGTPGRDSVLSLMMPGEGVVTTRGMASLGAAGLRALNEGLTPRRFALGGLVAPRGEFAAAGGARLGGSIGLDLAEGLIARAVAIHLESPEGERSVVKAVVRNPREVRDGLRDYWS